jgi:hypothetical protein
MNTSDEIAIGAAVIALLSFLWGIYSHISTRKVAKLFFDVSQISDTEMPQQFLRELSLAPVSIKVESTGTKNAENICLKVETISKIVRFESNLRDIGTLETPNIFNAVLAKMNPSQKFEVLLYCEGKPWENQVANIECTHSEGLGQDIRESQFSVIEFGMFGLELTYNAATGTFGGLRFGPLRFGKKS